MSPRLPQNAADRARRAPERGPRSAGVWPIRRSRQNDIASPLQRESRRQQNPTPPDSLVRGRALSAGEQLRLRIANVIAHVRIARDHGVGRHPGLLLIDSPGNEEVAQENLVDSLDELKNVTTETGGLQMFVV